MHKSLPVAMTALNIVTLVSGLGDGEKSGAYESVYWKAIWSSCKKSLPKGLGDGGQ